MKGSMRVEKIKKQLQVKCDAYPSQFVAVFDDYETKALKRLFKEMEEGK